MSPNFRTGIALVAITLSFAACAGPEPPPVGEAGDAVAHDEIAWFDGSVEEAFDFARTNDKPVFLYWGAVWCPPCHYLKDKIFTKPAFVAKSRQFVPVYLDGDTDRAQVWGEKLDAWGYPTVIILDPEGTEVLRMSADVPVEEYAEVLDLALAATRPIPDVLAEVLEVGPASADPADLGLLAFHSWEQDRTFDLSSPEFADQARRLWAEAPEDRQRERSRFLGLYLTALDTQDEPDLSTEERGELLAEVEAMIADPQLRKLNWFLFAYGLDSVAGALTEPGPDRDRLVDTWLEVAGEAEADESLTTAERLEAFRPHIGAARLAAGEDFQPSQELQAAVRDRVEWANERTNDPSELQSVMNAMAHLLRDSDQRAVAIELLESRIEDAVAPYYFMSWIGSLENDAGNHQIALDWYRRGWQTSSGPSTRLQRGAGYLNRVMKIAPDDLQAVRDDALALVEEQVADPSAFAGRNARSWARLAEGLQEWAGDDPSRMAVVTEIRDSVTGACDQAAPDADTPPGMACRGFLGDSVTL